MNNDLNHNNPLFNDSSSPQNNDWDALHNALNETDDTTASNFDEDAAEGLNDVNKTDLPAIVAQLNTQLQQQIKKKKTLNKKTIIDQTSTYITIVTILILVVVAYIVLKKILP